MSNIMGHKITITIATDSAIFETDPSLESEQVLSTVLPKVMEQVHRKPGPLCTHLEAADTLLDLNGNAIGTVQVEPS